MYFNELSIESRPKIFNWNKLGAGRGGVHLQHFLILMSETSVLLGPFNHKTKFRTKLTCLLRMNLETSRIPPVLPVLMFNLAFYEFKCCYRSSHGLNLCIRIFVSVFTRLFKRDHKSLYGCFLECDIFVCNFFNYYFCSSV